MSHDHSAVSVPATVDEVAAHYRISPRHVRHLAELGVLVPYSRLGRAVRFDLNEVDRALKGRDA